MCSNKSIDHTKKFYKTKTEIYRIISSILYTFYVTATRFDIIKLFRIDYEYWRIGCAAHAPSITGQFIFFSFKLNIPTLPLLTHEGVSRHH